MDDMERLERMYARVWDAQGDAYGIWTAAWTPAIGRGSFAAAEAQALMWLARPRWRMQAGAALSGVGAARWLPRGRVLMRCAYLRPPRGRG